MPGLNPGLVAIDPDGNIGARRMVIALISQGTELGLQVCLAPPSGEILDITVVGLVQLRLGRII
jgi:hypothetical protein